MKFVPRHSSVIGRMAIKKLVTSIVRPNESKDTTKFMLIDAVGPGAEAAGLKVGDVVIPTALGNIVLDGGVSFRPIVEEKDIAAFVTEVSLDELVVQTDNASKYVPFGDPDAAQSLGAVVPQEDRKPEAA